MFLILFNIQIKRVENRSLYLGYRSKRIEIKEACSNDSGFEMTLWHGTSSEMAKTINNKGFNRSYYSSENGMLTCLNIK